MVLVLFGAWVSVGLTWMKVCGLETSPRSNSRAHSCPWSAAGEHRAVSDVTAGTSGLARVFAVQQRGGSLHGGERLLRLQVGGGLRQLATEGAQLCDVCSLLCGSHVLILPDGMRHQRYSAMQPLPRGLVTPDGALLFSFVLYIGVLLATCFMVSVLRIQAAHSLCLLRAMPYRCVLSMLS